jgi:hypothetical protein
MIAERSSPLTTIRVPPIRLSVVPDLDARVIVIRRWFRPELFGFESGMIRS